MDFSYHMLSFVQFTDDDLLYLLTYHYILLNESNVVHFLANHMAGFFLALLSLIQFTDNDLLYLLAYHYMPSYESNVVYFLANHMDGFFIHYVIILPIYIQ